MNLKTILTLNSLFFFILNLSFAQVENNKTLISDELYRIKLHDKGIVSGAILEIKTGHVIVITEGDTLSIPRKQIMDIRKIKNQKQSQTRSEQFDPVLLTKAKGPKGKNLTFNINGFREDAPSILKSNLLVDNHIEIPAGEKTRFTLQLGLYPDINAFVATGLVIDLKENKLIHPYLNIDLAQTLNIEREGQNIGQTFAGLQGGITIGTPEYFINTMIGPVFSVVNSAGLSGFKIHTDFQITLRDNLYLCGEHKSSPYEIITVSNFFGVGFTTGRFTGQVGFLNVQVNERNFREFNFSSISIPSLRLIKPF